MPASSSAAPSSAVRSVLGVMALLPVVAFGQTSAAINTGIAKALSSGQKEYVLPAGTVDLDATIQIPISKGFTLRGHPTGTKLVTSNPIGVLINVGPQVSSGNNYGLTNRALTPVSDAAEGAQTLSLRDFKSEGDKATSKIVVGQAYGIYDDYWLSHPANGSVGFRTHFEIVRVTGYDAKKGRLTLNAPLGRSYSNATLSSIEPVCGQNLTIQDISFDGRGRNGKSSGGFVGVSLTDGVTLRNLKGVNFSSWGIVVGSSRNVLIENCEVRDASNTNIGEGYAINLSRCRSVRVLNTKAYNARHGIMLHAGTTGALIQECYVENANYDTHGFGERDVTFVRCTGNSNLALGNDAWSDGVAKVRAYDCEFNGLYLSQGVSDFQMLNGKVTNQIRIIGPGKGKPPTGILLENVAVSARSSLIQAVNEVGTFTMNGGSLTSTSDPYSSVIALSPKCIDLRLLGVRIVSNSPYAWVPSVDLSKITTACSVQIEATYEWPSLRGRTGNALKPAPVAAPVVEITTSTSALTL